MTLSFGTLRTINTLSVSPAPPGIGSPISRAHFEHLIFLPPLPGCWDYRHRLPCLILWESFLDQGRWRIPTQDGGGSGKQTSKGAARPMTLEGLQKSRLRRRFESQLCCPGAESLKSRRWQSTISAEVWLWVFHGHGQNSLLSHPEDFKWTQESCWSRCMGQKRTEGHAAVGIVSLPIPTPRGTEVCFIIYLCHTWNRLSWKLVIKAEIKEKSGARGDLASPTTAVRRFK